MDPLILRGSGDAARRDANTERLLSRGVWLRKLDLSSSAGTRQMVSGCHPMC
jgi:hypothetical protein